MPVFEYKALGNNGAATLGQIEAGGRGEAARALEERGLTPLKLAEIGGVVKGSSANRVKEPGKPIKWPWTSDKVPFAALEDFTRSLSSLLAASVPLSRALTILYKESSYPAAAPRWRALHDLVVDGVALAEAMNRDPQTFPQIYVAMVEAGEAGGFLEVVLAQIAEFQAREKELKAKVTAAMIYPAVLLCLAIGVIIFLLTFFIPQMQPLFADLGGKLPTITLAIVAVSNFARTYGIFFLAAVIGGAWYGRSWLGSEANRRRWEAWLLRLPVTGSLAAQFALARFCRMLGTLLGAGVPLVSALQVARRSLGNRTLVDLVTDATERVKRGEPLAASLADCRSLFGGSALEMISVAEESGRLDVELIRLASVTEVVLDRQLKTAVALAEPLMLFAIAGFIGTIFIGMVLPIFSIQDQIK